MGKRFKKYSSQALSVLLAAGMTVQTPAALLATEFTELNEQSEETSEFVPGSEVQNENSELPSGSEEISEDPRELLETLGISQEEAEAMSREELEDAIIYRWLNQSPSSSGCRAAPRALRTIETSASLTGMVSTSQEEPLREDGAHPGLSGADQQYKGSILLDLNLSQLLMDSRTKFEEMRMSLPNISDLRERPRRWPVNGPNGSAAVVSIRVTLPAGFSAQAGTSTISSKYIKDVTVTPSEQGAVVAITIDPAQTKYGELFDNVLAGTAGTIQVSIPVEGQIAKGDSLDITASLDGSSQLQHVSQLGDIDVNVTIPAETVSLVTDTENRWLEDTIHQTATLNNSLKINNGIYVNTLPGDKLTLSNAIDPAEIAKKLTEAAASMDTRGADLKAAACDELGLVFTQTFRFPDHVNVRSAKAAVRSDMDFDVVSVNAADHTVTVDVAPKLAATTYGELETALEAMGMPEIILTDVTVEEGAQAGKAMSVQAETTGFLNTMIRFPYGGSYSVRQTFDSNQASAQLVVPKPVEMEPIDVQVSTSLLAGNAQAGAVYKTEVSQPFSMKGILDTTAIKETLEALVGDHAGSSANPLGIGVSDVSFAFQAVFTLPQGVQWTDGSKASFTGSDRFEVLSASQDGNNVTVQFGLKDAASIDSLNDLLQIAAGTEKDLVLTLDGFALEETAKNAQTFNVKGVIDGQLRCQIRSSSNALVNVTVHFADHEEKSAAIQARVMEPGIEKEFSLPSALMVNGSAQGSVKENETYSVAASLDLSEFQEFASSKMSQFAKVPSNMISLENTTLGFDVSLVFPNGTDLSNAKIALDGLSSFKAGEPVITKDKSSVQLDVHFGMDEITSFQQVVDAMEALEHNRIVTLTVSNVAATGDMINNTWKNVTFSLKKGGMSGEMTLIPNSALYSINMPFTAQAAKAQVRKVVPIVLDGTLELPAAISTASLEVGAQYRTRPNTPFSVTGMLDASQIKQLMATLMSSRLGLENDLATLPVNNPDVVFTAQLVLPAGIVWDQSQPTIDAGNGFEIKSAVRNGQTIIVTVGLKDGLSLNNLKDLAEIVTDAPDQLKVVLPGLSVKEGAKANQEFSIPGTLTGSMHVETENRVGIPATISYAFNGTGDHLSSSIIATVPAGSMKQEMKLTGSMDIDGQARKDVEAGVPFTMTSRLDITPIAQLLNAQITDKDSAGLAWSDVKLEQTDFGFKAEYSLPAGLDLEQIQVSLPEGSPFQVTEVVKAVRKLTVSFDLARAPETMQDLMDVAQAAGDELVLTIEGLKATDAAGKNQDQTITGNVAGHLKTEIHFPNYIIYNADLSFVLEQPAAAAFRILKEQKLEASMNIPAWISIDPAASGSSVKKRPSVPFSLTGSIDTTPIRAAMQVLIDAGSTSSINPERIPVKAADLLFTAAFTLPADIDWQKTEAVLKDAEDFTVIRTERDGNTVVVTMGLANAEGIKNLQDLIHAAASTPDVIELTVGGFVVTDQNPEKNDRYEISGAVSGILDAHLENHDSIPYHMVYTFKGVETENRGSLKATVLPVFPTVISKQYELSGSLSVDGQAKKDVEVDQAFSVVSTLDITEISQIFDDKLGDKEELFGALDSAALSDTEFGFTAVYSFPAGTDLSEAEAVMIKDGPFEVTGSKVEGTKLTVTFGMKEQPKTMKDLTDMAQSAGDSLQLTINGVKVNNSIAKNQALNLTGDVTGVLKTSVAVSDDTILRPEIEFALDAPATASIRVLKTVEVSQKMEIAAWIAPEGAKAGEVFKRRAGVPFAMKGSLDTSDIRELMNTLVEAGSTSSINPEQIPVDAANLTFTAGFELPEGMSWKADAEPPVLSGGQVFKVLSQKLDGNTVVVEMGLANAEGIQTLADLINAAKETPETLELTVKGFSIDEDSKDAKEYTIKGSVSGTLDASLKNHEQIPYHMVFDFNGVEDEEKGSLSAEVASVLPTVISKEYALSGNLTVDGQTKKDVEVDQAFSVVSTLDITEISQIFGDKLGDKEELFGALASAALSDTEFGFTAVYSFPAGTDLSEAEAVMTKDGPFEVTGSKVEGTKLTVTFGMKEQPKTMKDLIDMAQSAGDSLRLAINGVKVDNSIAKNQALNITGDVTGALKTSVAVSDDTILRPEIEFALDAPASAAIRVLEEQVLEASMQIPAWIRIDNTASGSSVKKRLNAPFSLTGSIDTTVIKAAMDAMIKAGTTASVDPSAVPVKAADLRFTAEFAVPEGITWTQTDAVLKDASAFKVLSTEFAERKVKITIGLNDAQPIENLQDLMNAASSTPDVIDLTTGGFALSDENADASSRYEIIGAVSGILNAKLNTGDGIPFNILYSFNGVEAENKGSLKATVLPVVPTVIKKSMELDGSMLVDGQAQKDVVVDQAFRVESKLNIRTIQDFFQEVIQNQGEIYDELSKAAVSDTEFGFTAVYTFPAGSDLSGVQAEMSGDSPFEVKSAAVDGRTLTVTFGMKEEPKDMTALIAMATASGDELVMTIGNIKATEDIARNRVLPITGTVSGSLKTSADVAEDTILRPEIDFSLPGEVSASIRVPKTVVLENTVEVPAWISAGSKQSGQILPLTNESEFALKGSISTRRIRETMNQLISGGSTSSAHPDQIPVSNADLCFIAQLSLPTGIEWNAHSSVTLSDQEHFQVVSSELKDGKVVVTMSLKDADSIESLQDLIEIASNVEETLTLTMDGFKLSDDAIVNGKKYTVTGEVSGELTASVRTGEGIPCAVKVTFEGQEDAASGSMQAVIQGVVTQTLEQSFEFSRDLEVENQQAHDVKAGDQFAIESRLDIQPAVDAFEQWIADSAAQGTPDSILLDGTTFHYAVDYTFPEGVDLSAVKATLHGNRNIKVTDLQADGNVLHVTFGLGRTVNSLSDLAEIAADTSASNQMRLRLSNLLATDSLKANQWLDITADSKGGSFSTHATLSETSNVQLDVTFGLPEDDTVSVRRRETISLGTSSEPAVDLSVNDGAAGETVEAEAGQTITLNAIITTDALRQQIDDAIAALGENGASAEVASPSAGYTVVYTLPEGTQWDGTVPTVEGMNVFSALKDGNKVTVQFAMDLSQVKTLGDLKTALDDLPDPLKAALPGVQILSDAQGKNLAAGIEVSGSLKADITTEDGLDAQLNIPLQGIATRTDLLAVKPAIDPITEKIPMYRVYNPNSGEHFYTADAHERDVVVSCGWNDEGIGWYAPRISNTPVYRLYNENAGDHHYTTEIRERDALVSLGWKDEGIGWYSDDDHSVPLYRQYNPNAKAGAHNFTTDLHEHEFLVKIGWIGEGIAWYGVK